LFELIEELLEPWKKVVTVIYRTDLRIDQSYNIEMKIHFTRIIQELINNISKYAEASTMSVHVRQSKSGLAIILKDNGIGFSMDQNKRGLGLKNIETRVQYLKGHYKTKSKIGVGTSTLFVFNHIYNTVNE
jgi:signal transduction histidine kinase